jgi:DnaK suppressor protein
MSSHNPEFIEEMKRRLEAERVELREELESLGQKGSGDGLYEADFPEYGRNDEENASEIADYVATTSTTEALELRLKEVEAALERIAEGVYGVTVEGEIIPEDRLQANPAATTLVKK